MANRQGVNFDALTKTEIADAFKVTTKTIENWCNDGCPVTKGTGQNSYSLYQVHNWLISREVEKLVPSDGESLKDQKTKKEIERLTAQVNKINERYIDIDVHNSILAARAKSLAIFFTTGAIKNAVHYAGKTLQEIQTIRFQEAKEAMDVYLGTN